MVTDYHPITHMNSLIPCFRKAVKSFKDNGDSWFTLHFYQGGLRAPRIEDDGDKRKIKKKLSDFLNVWGKPCFTGQVAFFMRHGEFTDMFNAYPGSGSYDGHQKEGVQFKVSRDYDEYLEGWFYRIYSNGMVTENDLDDAMPF